MERKKYGNNLSWLGMAGNGWKWLEIEQMAGYDWKLLELPGNGFK